MSRLLLILALTLAPLCAAAQALEERIVQALALQGFTVTEMDRTWLGRLWVVAQSDTLYRELIFDPATGEILQDYVTRLSTHQSQIAERDDPRRRTQTGGIAALSEPGADATVAGDWSDVVTEPEIGVTVDLPDPVVSDGN